MNRAGPEIQGLMKEAQKSSRHTEERAAFEGARDLLLSRVNAESLNGRRLVRMEIEAPSLCPLEWLAAQRDVPRYYWCDRDRQTEMAGAGEAHVIASEGTADIHAVFETVQRYLPPDNPDARYYGGFRFHPDFKEDMYWKGFKASRFVVPLVEVYRRGDRTFLACTLCDEQTRNEAVSLLGSMHYKASYIATPLPHFQDRSDTPKHAEWRRMVRQALEAIQDNRLGKVVLARQTIFHAAAGIDPVALMQRLSRKASGVYLFCFQPSATRAFLGASPERLYRRDGLQLQSEALAGTRPRGRNVAWDHRHEKDLLANDKDGREHRIVVEGILRTLRPFCTRVEAAPAPRVLKLAHCQHLLTPISGEIEGHVRDDHLLEALHPTPAVGGKPAKAALRWILQHEPFERGVYAAPVGWLGKDKAEFSVGIRSGLILEDTLALYAGAGIVAGSDPDAEWRELDAKMAQFLNIILEEH